MLSGHVFGAALSIARQRTTGLQPILAYANLITSLVRFAHRPGSTLAPVCHQFLPIDNWLRARLNALIVDQKDMRIGDLKRAVEDVILKPDENSLAELSKRDTIAALDLCRVDPTSSIPAHVPSAATMNNCSCSSETVPNEIPQRQPPQLCTSTSLDTIMNRPQPIFHRHSAGVSRRQSKVISSLQSKRKRSNSLTNYNKSHGQSVSLPQSARQTPMRFGEEELYKSSLGSSDSHSSIAKSEDYTRDFVAEEDESVIGQYLMTEGCSANSSCTTSANPFFSYRETREDEDMDCD